MAAIGTATITRIGTKTNFEADSQRLGLELTAENSYHGSFTAQLLEIDPISGAAIVVKDNGRLYQVKLHEITNFTFSV